MEVFSIVFTQKMFAIIIIIIDLSVNTPLSSSYTSNPILSVMCISIIHRISCTVP